MLTVNGQPLGSEIRKLWNPVHRFDSGGCVAIRRIVG